MGKKHDTIDTEALLKTYFDQIKTIPLLTFEEELELSKRIQQGDTAAWHTLIEANLRLVIKIAWDFLSSGVFLMDLIQEGNIGLMRAAEKYDHHKKVRFSTYANWWIRQSISRYLDNCRRTIRLPHRKEEILRKIQNACHALSQTLMRQPKSEELAAHLNIPLEDVERVLNMTSGLISLEADRGGDELNSSIVDFHEDYTYNPEWELIQKSLRADTLRLLDRLKEREKQILMYRYQLNGYEYHTLKKIGDKMGLSPETVRQIELKAIKKIRGDMGAQRDAWYGEAI
jgi:RNA polymerase primary sigma factor